MRQSEFDSGCEFQVLSAVSGLDVYIYVHYSYSEIRSIVMPTFRNTHQTDFNLSGALPSSPPLDLMDHVAGYENVSFDAVSVPPPESGSDSCSVDNESPDVPESPPHPTEQQARAALKQHIKKHCCYGQQAVNNMAITKIDYSFAYHYELQTYTEKRETSWAFAPYGGGEVDGVDIGLAPQPWDIKVFASSYFVDEVKSLQVPHTASVKQCHRCKGIGSLQCSECHGKGWARCLSCHGDGYSVDKERCFYCRSSAHGCGRQDCLKCNAKGKIVCQPCDSTGLIRCYIELTVTWKVNTSEYIVPLVALPENLVRTVTGQIAYEEERSHVEPIADCPNEAINMAAAQLVDNHGRWFQDQRTLRQRQQVRVIPVTDIHYEWKHHNKEFFIYGYENKVYAPNYPETCCWGCTVL